MIFGELPTPESLGAILAHSVRQAGVSFSKGRRLSADDVETLRSAGVETVVVARLESGDVHEDEAARRLAEAIAGPGAVTTDTRTGRCNLLATDRGLFLVDEARLNRLNLIDEAISIATARPCAPVEPRQMIATVKIVPFALSADVMGRALRIIADEPIVRIAGFVGKRVRLIQTTFGTTAEKVLRKTRTSLDQRLASLGGTVVEELHTRHRTDALADLLRSESAARWDLMIISGASATVDRRDVVPAALENAGGRVEHFGMPVDPGNLLLLGRLGDKPVIGTPGCARSPGLNGFDWVLQRLFADLEVRPEDIMTMGVGGLLKETTRPLPRSAAVESSPAQGSKGSTPKVVALVLAAGKSSRMGEPNKLLEPVGGLPMLHWALKAAAGSQVAECLVVTGHQRPEVEEPVARFQTGRDAGFIRSVHNPSFDRGLSTSLKVGVAALDDDVEAVVVLLGDMPKVTSGHVDALIDRYAPAEGRSICLPTRDGRRGNPVLFARRYFPEVQTLSGDVGARALLSQYPDQVAEVPFDEDDAVVLDVDTPEALRRLTGSDVNGSTRSSG